MAKKKYRPRIRPIARKAKDGRSDLSAPDVKSFLFMCYSTQRRTNIHMNTALEQASFSVKALPSMSFFGLSYTEVEGVKRCLRHKGREFKVWRSALNYSTKYDGSRGIITII